MVIIVSGATTVALFMPVLLFMNGSEGFLSTSENLRNLFGNVVKVFYSTQFALSVLIIQKRFEALNSFLTSKAFENNSKKSTMFMKELSFVRIYNKLCDAIEVVNEAFTFHFVPIFAYTLVSLLVEV